MPFTNLSTRNPNGVNNCAPWQTMANAGHNDPTWSHQYSNDFDTYAPGDWGVTVIGTGTQALIPYDGGAILLSNSAGIADASYLQPAVASFQLLATKEVFFKFNGVLSDVLNGVFFAGLIAKSATPLAAADGLYILKPTGAAALQLVSVIGGVTTVVAFPAASIPVAGIAFEVGIHVDFQGNVEAFFNPTTGFNPITPANAAAGQARGRVASAAFPSAPALTQVLLAPSFGLLNSTAAVRTLTVDYVVAARNR